MADVRSLLRQQRAARRIDHPHAAYSDAGKLLCLACHEPLRSDSLWEAHVRSAAHKAKAASKPIASTAPPKDDSTSYSTRDAPTATPASHKRKQDDADDDQDISMLDAEDSVRKKRSRTDMATTTTTTSTHAPPMPSESQESASAATATNTGAMLSPAGSSTPTANNGSQNSNSRNGGGRTPQSQTHTPPLTRRQSSTPVMGVEMQMPSRPATPNALRDNNTPTPGGSTAVVVGLGVMQAPTATVTAIAAAPMSAPETAAAPIDEDEWAAFEREVVNAAPAPAAADSAIISAAPMTADEVAIAAAAAGGEDGRSKRRAAADIELEDEKEDAKRALEDEFEEMEELEARVRRLKERRELLRSRSAAGLGATAAATAAGGKAVGKPKDGDNKAVKTGVESMDGLREGGEDEEDDEEEDDDDDDDDDFESFRLRR